MQPLLKVAGSDVSHWFDANVVDTVAGREVVVEIKTYIDPVTNMRRPHLPMGRFLHVAPSDPVVDWSETTSMPWRNDPSFVVGKLSMTMSKIRLKNVLTGQEHLMSVPSEESISDIRQRYLEYNWHAESYAWKILRKEQPDGDFTFVDLDLGKTLAENGIVDDTKKFEELAIPSDFFIPVIHLYYTDDLTVA